MRVRMKKITANDGKVKKAVTEHADAYEKNHCKQWKSAKSSDVACGCV